jgi:hypothetical protein
VNRFVRSGIALTALITCGLAWSAAAVHAQEPQSREDEIAAAQAEKAKALTPYVPTRAERLIAGFRREAIEAPSGPFPFFDNALSGGGFTLGAGYRQFFADASYWDFKGSWTFKNYKLFETSTRIPFGDHSAFGFRVGWRDAPEAAYYGLGIDTVPEARANYTWQQTVAEGLLALRPRKWIVIDGAVAYEDYTIDPGKGSAPSIETIYNPVTAPGLGSSPTYLHSQGTLGIDWRPFALYARKGGFYGVTFHNYADSDDALSFDKLDADVVQHIPIFRDTWVLSFHGRIETTLDDDDVVPFFMLPSLGSGRTLRAYSSWRFRDRHSILGQAEFRWIPNRLGMDMALFYDAGKVTARREDLDFDGLKSDYGIGVRFHLPAFTFLRIEGARGSEGWHLVFASGAAF